MRALHAIKDEVSGLRQRLEAERGARTAADTFGVTWEQLARQKLDRPSSSVLLEAISRLLPDDAWLTELRVDNDIVRMTGHARNSGRLIAAIEATPQLRNAEFAGPTSLRTSDQLETFVITARAVPRLQQRN